MPLTVPARRLCKICSGRCVEMWREHLQEAKQYPEVLLLHQRGPERSPVFRTEGLCTECARMSGFPTSGILPTLQVLVNPQGKDNGAAVEKNMRISLIQSLVSTLQLNERPKSQAGQPGKVNIDSGLPPGPSSSLQVLCCGPAIAQARAAL